MRVRYKGFELYAERKTSRAGCGVMYYSIHKDSHEYIFGLDYSKVSAQEKIQELKEWVGNFLDCISMNICWQCDGDLSKTEDNTLFCLFCGDKYIV